jgi:hypothetical protein
MGKKVARDAKSIVVTKCDGCSATIRVGEHVMFFGTGEARRGPNDIKRANLGNLLGVLCRRCCPAVITDIVGSVANPHRVSIGLPNHGMGACLSDIAHQLTSKVKYRHIEVERLNKDTLLVRVLPFDPPNEVSFTYDMGSRVLTQVPSREAKA